MRTTKWMVCPGTRSKQHSNGKRREVRAIEKRTRREGQTAVRDGREDV